MRIRILFVFVSLMLMSSACSNSERITFDDTVKKADQGVQAAGEKVDRGAQEAEGDFQKAGRDVDEGLNKAGEEMQKAGNTIDRGLNKAGREIQQGFDQAGQDVRDATR